MYLKIIKGYKLTVRDLVLTFLNFQVEAINWCAQRGMTEFNRGRKHILLSKMYTQF